MPKKTMYDRFLDQQGNHKVKEKRDKKEKDNSKWYKTLNSRFNYTLENNVYN